MPACDEDALMSEDAVTAAVVEGDPSGDVGRAGLESEGEWVNRFEVAEGGRLECPPPGRLLTLSLL